MDRISIFSDSKKIIFSLALLILALPSTSCSTKTEQNNSVEKITESTNSSINTTAAQNSPSAIMDISGKYLSEHTGDKGWGGVNVQKPFSYVTIKQNGNQIKGRFGSTGGELEGSITDNTVSFKWYSIQSQGKGKWTILSSGNELVGKWSSDQYPPNGKWNLKKINSANSKNLVPDKRDPAGFTELHRTVIAGDLEKVKEAIGWGADVNARVFRGRTPYALAIVNDHAEIIKLLQQKNIQVSTNYKESSVIYDASFMNNVDVLNYLMSRGVDFNISNSNQENAMHMAASAGNKEAVSFLLERNVEVNQKTITGALPVHYAAFAGHLEIVDTLIEAGALVSVVNDDAKDFYSTAKLYEHLGDKELSLGQRENAKTMFEVACPSYSEASRLYESLRQETADKISSTNSTFMLRFALAILLVNASPDPYASTFVRKDKTLNAEEFENFLSKQAKDSDSNYRSCQDKLGNM